MDINSVELYLDITNKGNAKEIIETLKENKNKFKLIILKILKGTYDDLLYRKEVKMLLQ